jgi:hypothetical protein
LVNINLLATQGSRQHKTGIQKEIVMSLEEISRNGRSVFSASIALLQKNRVAVITRQDELIAQGNLNEALDSARAYSRECEVTFSKSRLRLSTSEQNKVGWFVNAITLGFNRKAQNVCFSIMRELLVMLETEKLFAEQRLAELQTKATCH